MNVELGPIPLEGWTALVPAASWLAALPGLLLAVALLWVPGGLMARWAGARGLVAAAVAPVLTLGVLGLLVLVQQVVWPVLGMGVWFTPVILGWLVLAVAASFGLRLLAGWRAVPDRSPAARPRERRVDALPAALGCLVSGATFLLATGSAGTPEQSNDSPFHLLAIARVLQLGNGSWTTVSGTSGHASFYPPLFDDVGAAIVRVTGLDVVSASNVLVLLAVALIWPLGIDALVRTVLTAGVARAPRWHPERVARAAAMLLVPATAAFPAQLARFGALWPNLLGLALVPAVLAALVDLTYPAGRTGQRASLWTPALDGAVLVAGAVALALAHPSALLSFLVLASGLILSGLARSLRRRWVAGSRAVVLGVLAALVAVVLLAVVVVSRSSLLASVSTFGGARPWSVPEALGRVASGYVVGGTHPSLVAVLALVGLVSCIVRRRHRWLVVGWALAALQVVIAGAVSGPVTGLLTGAWYRETARLSSAVTVASLALAAVGAVAVAVGVSRVPGLVARRSLAAVVAVVAAAWLGLGVHDVYQVERDTYQGLPADRALVTPPEAALYARLLRPAGTGVRVDVPIQTVIGADDEPGYSPAVVGDPFGGAMFASLYSGRPTPIRHFGQALSGPTGSAAAATGLVASSFTSFATDPAVCAAVKQLRIGYAVEDTNSLWSDDTRHSRFAGLRGLAGVKGLELMGREGTVSVYRLTTCLAGPPR